MLFEWDENKRGVNLAKHRVDFADAAQIFERSVVTRIDDRRDYSEERLISLGISDGDCFVVVHTRRGTQFGLFWLEGRTR